MQGNFEIVALVEPSFGAIYDAGCIMAWSSQEKWCKFCFELTDLGHKAVVSVNTDKTSDDCNGIVIDRSKIFMKMTGNDSVVALHYSYDGVKYFMHRLCKFCLGAIKVGFVAQSPTGDGNRVIFSDIKISNSAKRYIRNG